MKKKSIAKNYIYNVLYEILAIIIPLITTPYLSRVLHAENIGIYSYTISIVTYFILFGSLGIAMYGKREIAYLQNDIEKRSKTFFEIFILKFISLSISMMVFYFTFCMSGEYSFYYKILLLEVFANLVDISWYFQGIEEFKRTVTRNIIVKFISTISIFIFIKTQNDLWKYFLIYVLSTLLGNLSLWLYIPKYVIKIKTNELSIKKHLKPTIMLFIPQIATQVYTVLDKTMIGSIISDKSEVGFYEQAQKIIKLLLTLATSFGTVMMPRIASTFVNGTKDQIKKYLNNSFAFVTMISFPLMFGMISISSKFVPIFYGNGFEKVDILLCIISPIIVLIGLSNVIGVQYLLPTKQQNKYTLSVIVGAVVNFILNIILIKKYASIGASIATVLAELCVTMVQILLVRKQIKLKDIIKLSYKYFIASLIMFFISLTIGNYMNNNVLCIIIQIVISALLFFAILFVLKDKFFIDILDKYKVELLRRNKK